MEERVSNKPAQVMHKKVFIGHVLQIKIGRMISPRYTAHPSFSRKNPVLDSGVNRFYSTFFRSRIFGRFAAWKF